MDATAATDAGDGGRAADTPLRVGRGPRAVEALLLGELEGLVAATRAAPGRLALPARVVVPSRGLREHVCAALVRRVGHGTAGIRVDTLHGLALDVIDRAGERAARGDDLVPLLVRRAARREDVLRRAFEGLEDGYGAVGAAVSDLLDAGFAPDVAAHGDAVDDALATAALDADVRERVRAVVRVAAATARELERLGSGRAGARIARAAELLERDPGLLPARALLIHGFADATGVVSDLLGVLVRRCAGRIFVDRPPDPARPQRDDLGVAFTARLLRRLGLEAGALPAASSAPPQLAALAAVGADAEVRAVADRIHRLLADGARAEGIGIVARDLASYAVPLRTQLGRLGVPFSGSGTRGPPAAEGRRLHALLDLLARRGETAADRWLDIVAELPRDVRFDLRLGLHALGAARLADVAGLDADARLGAADALPLPTRRGLAADADAEGGERAVRPRRRWLPGRLLRRAVEAARETQRRLEEWPIAASLSRHLQELEALLGGPLGWRRGEQGPLAQVLAGLRADLPDLALDLEEFGLLLRRALRGAGDARLGGAGAGVQVLGVVEARGRSFEHLFVLGVGRGVLPRPVLEDPLLPDAVRRALEAVLPEMPVKARGFEEEHYLFAQLVSSSPRVTLSWQVADDTGRARSPSPFVERLRSAEVPLRWEAAPSLQAPPERSPGRPRTAAEAALAEALHGSPQRFAALFALAARERAEFDVAAGPPVAPEALSRARLAALDELADRPGRSDLGPYFGFVGPLRDAADPRARDLYVTRIEALVRCPWQVFLSHILGVEPPPDAAGGLPELGPLLVGSLVHRVLQEIVERAIPQPPPDVAGATGRAVPWPEAADLEALLRRCAAALLLQEGLGPPELARLLVETARPLVDAARALGWPEPGSEIVCLGAEVDGCVGVAVGAAGVRELHFRADRVDRVAGALRWIDYKTGRPPMRKKDAPRLQVARGASLQAPAYALGGGGEGRYLFLARGADPAAVVAMAAEDAGLRADFEAALATAVRAFEAGSFFPRLVKPDGEGLPVACGWCELREACLQGDAGARGRLVAWAQAAGARAGAEGAALALWRLPAEEGT